MKEYYVQDNKILVKTEMEREIELIKNIIHTREELKNANINFEFANGDLVDYYTYQIKANQSKLDYLIKIAKKNGIEFDVINHIEFSKWEKSEKAI